ncbi:MAG: methyltransferase domain-containing protein [Deltaproteobacteria bacterium]|nr:methyltransferase domain-containing protein [Deltaproteobacteria bacterium]
MFESYAEIFSRRGAQYQTAMLRWPAAREAEFLQVLADASLSPDLVAYDVPAGGGYLSRHVDPGVHWLEIETTAGFTSGQAAPQQILCSSLTSIELADASADRIISLAGLHHVPDRSGVYREFARLLRPAGLLALADVAEGSAAAAFLNEFVDRHCPMGHRGVFLGAELAPDVRAAGFDILADRSIDLHWRFGTTDDMADFCRLLFGLETDNATTLAGIRDHVGYEEGSGQVLMNWALRHVRARKT